jgi:hypothetical protein
MTDDERREARWIGRAQFAAGLVGAMLSGIGFWAAGQRDVPKAGVEALFAGVLVGVFPGYVIGMIGAAARTPGRASLVGACLVGLPMLLWGEYREPISVQLWRIAGFAALGSILCQVGAVASGTAACGTKQPEKIQFTVRQFLVFFIPVAIYFGYLRTLMQK